MDYQAAWKFLDDLQFFKMKLGLGSMVKFLERLGHPEEKLRFIHVGGTNGKGSVAKTLLTILTAAGYKAGLYTSPHLNSVRERFMIRNAFISEADFADHAGRIIAALAHEQITYFEFTTALALQWFAEQRVDLAILEVGMGGRLDATNIISPLVAIITNVSMDHEAYLGRTLAAVAAEKAGIIKHGVPLVSGVIGASASAVVRQRARELAAPLLELNRDFSMTRAAGVWHYEAGLQRQIAGVELALRGEYQGDNAALAVAVLDILAAAGFPVPDEVIRRGLARVSWPGRLEFLSCPDPVNGTAQNYLLDGAHNPAGVRALVTELQKFAEQGIIMVWASMADKDFGACLRLIAPLCREIIFTRPEENRSAVPERLAAELGGCGVRSHTITPVAAALTLAAQLAGRGELICVAGSLYLVGKARAIIMGALTDA